MADRNSDYRSDRRPRWSSQHGEREQSGWQQEQFETSNRGWRDDDTADQLGETNWNRENDRSQSSNRTRGRRGADLGNTGTATPYGQNADYDARGYQDQGRTYGGYTGTTWGSSYSGGPFTSEDFGGRDFSRGAGDWHGRSNFGGYGAGYTSGAYTGDPYGDRRGFFERAGDEVASWFGDKDAARRREEDHSGRGPSNYTRSDSRILEDVSDRITDDWRVDGRNIQVTVDDGEVTLDGTVSSREHKRRAEDCAEAISGVKHVQNNLRVDSTTPGADAASQPGPFI